MYQGNFLERVCCLCEFVFCTWEYTLGLYWHQSAKLCFEPSQFATVMNCDKSGIPTVAICDLSQFVTKTVSWQIQSNNIENVFCVYRRVPKFSFDRNLRSWVLNHFRVNCHRYCILSHTWVRYPGFSGHGVKCPILTTVVPGFQAIWLAVPFGANGAHLGICTLPEKSSLCVK